MFKELNPILHSQLRLAIMSILLTVEEAEFVYLKEKTQSTAGNLSVQLDKLSEAGYIEVEKSFVGKRPRTACRITAGGRKAMEECILEHHVKNRSYERKSISTFYVAGHSLQCMPHCSQSS